MPDKKKKRSRREIAEIAAEARWKSVASAKHAPYSGALDLGHVSLQCAVLEDGTRLISQRTVFRALGTAPSRKVDGLPPYLSAANLQPFIGKKLRRMATSLIPYQVPGGLGSSVAHGLPAEAIVLVCEVYLDARRAGALHYTQEAIALQAELIVSALAKTGIIALVDEVTGYQYARAKDDLSQILKKLISEELAGWVKTFPDEFFAHLYRLRGKKPGAVKNRHPMYFGHDINKIVYKRLSPGLKQALDRRNPVVDGRRKATHHQHLSREEGVKMLKAHMDKVLILMQATPDGQLKQFFSSLDRVVPMPEALPEDLVDEALDVIEAEVVSPSPSQPQSELFGSL